MRSILQKQLPTAAMVAAATDDSKKKDLAVKYSCAVPAWKDKDIKAVKDLPKVMCSLPFREKVMEAKNKDKTITACGVWNICIN